VTCETCDGLGMLIQEWTDAPHDFAVCLCQAGQAFRVAENRGRRTVPHWRVWCSRWQVDPSRVFLLEEVYSRDELAAAGLTAQPTAISREASLLAAGRRSRK
jgi:hypothetical protein